MSTINQILNTTLGKINRGEPGTPPLLAFVPESEETFIRWWDALDWCIPERLKGLIHVEYCRRRGVGWTALKHRYVRERGERNGPDGGRSDPGFVAMQRNLKKLSKAYRKAGLHTGGYSEFPGLMTAAAGYTLFASTSLADVRGRPDRLGLAARVCVEAFRPGLAFDPAWRTSAAVGLAEAVYHHERVDRLPILADALEDAGFPHAEVLAYLRETADWFPGEWAVDRLLDKDMYVVRRGASWNPCHEVLPE